MFFAKAVAAAMRTYPIANASLLDEEIHIHADVHVGIAVATDAGLLVPVLRNADRRPWRDAGAELRRLLDAARAGRSTPSDLAGGTVTVTNYGSIGGRFANPIIRPPEVCIVGFGAIAPRPIVVDGVVVARPTLPIVVTADHRLVDGDVAAGVLREISRRLADPIRFLID